MLNMKPIRIDEVVDPGATVIESYRNIIRSNSIANKFYYKIKG